MQHVLTTVLLFPVDNELALRLSIGSFIANANGYITIPVET